MLIREGQQAPNFTLPASDNSVFTLYDRLSEKTVILSFYPKNHLFACPSKKIFEQSKSLVDAYPQVKSLGAELYGISVDNLDSHKKFISEFGIPFLLLSDEKKEVIKIYADQNIFGLAKRSLVIIDRDRKIFKIIKDMDPYKAGDDLLSVLNNLSNQSSKLK